MRHAPILLVVISSIVFSQAGLAEVLNLREARFGAAGDGAADDRAALASALAALKPGDTLLIPPGSYRIVLTKEPLRVPAGVAVLGHSGQSKLMLFSANAASDHREFLHFSSNVTIEGLAIERAAEFPAVLLPVFGDVSGVTIRNCRIIGNCATFNGYCHGIQVGVGKLKNLLLDGVEISDCTYGLFQSNEATGSVEGVRVERCKFAANHGSDLEFNAPNGHMRDVTVVDCLFRDNRSKSGSAGFAVGFANVQGGRVENCQIHRCGSQALHVEDRSSDIRLSGNTISAGSTLQPHGVIMIIRGSRNVTIENNFIDARENKNSPHLVLVTAGGEKLANPTDVRIMNNILINGRATRTWYLQPGSSLLTSGNVVFPSSADGAPKRDGRSAAPSTSAARCR